VSQHNFAICYYSLMRRRPLSDADALRFVWQYEKARNEFPPHFLAVLSFLALQSDGVAELQVIAKQCDLTPQSVSRFSVEAESRGWVVRSKTEDRRYGQLKLTAAGRGAIGEIIHVALGDD
jgi:DNA-binding MarR family transcriptional regulator